MRRCLPQYVLTGLCVLGLAGCSDEVAGPNRAPVAVAGPDQVGEPGVEVLLDGSGSYDPDGDPITHQWMLLSAPAGSGLAALEQVAARQAVLAFTPDAAGTYVLGLVVSDGRLASARDVAQVRAGGERCEVDEDCPEDGNPCTARRCQAGRCVQEPLQDGTPCDDGLFCTLPDTCLGGVCQLGPRDCGDEDPCTEDVCNEALGQCENPRVSDPPPEGLDHPGTCEDGVDNDCDGLTDGADPDCKVCETDAECDDLEDCTADACLQGRCANSPTNEGGACEDGQYCTVGDTCQAGRCQGGPARDCSALDGECVRGACDEVLAACVEWPREDGTPCGARECQELWWVEGRCQAGACAGTGLVEDCDDANACTLDACEAQAGCSQTPEEDGAPCGEPVCDGLRFSRPSCEAGQCTALDLLEDCDDQNPCTDDQCDAQSGCQRVFNDDGCDDNDLCTELDACALGTCQGVPIDEDNDGYGPLALGCGPDCDDQDEFVNPGMYEGPFGDPKCSDGVDNDCDGLTDDQDPTCRQCIVDADCDDGLYCNGRETCAAGGVCAAGGNPCPQTECNRCQEATDLCFDPYGSPCGDPTTTTCTGPDTCDGAGVCQPNHAGPSTLCRPSVGVCDLAEYCPGDGSDCPANGYRPSSHECRASVGACDLAESCTGSAAACPADGFRPSTFECRASAGDCDLAEYCTGSAAACPPDMFRQSSTECRASAGDCDLAEYCTGSTAACPEDAFRPSTTECRASAGDCDLAENCTGSAADCPANGFRPSTFECRASAGVCDPAENCTGSSADCPANAFRPDTHECRETAGACDLAESCTGSAAACPPDTFRPSSTECRASAGDCDLAEYCTGSAAACPPDMFRQSSTECRASAGDCDLAEYCTGSTAACPEDAFRPSTTECRASAGDCDLAENCTGSAADCPANGFRPSTFECRASAGVCDPAENCTGSSADCPANAFRPDTHECRETAGACDLAESCTGSAAACPPDTFRPSSTECRASAGDCDLAEYCTGSAAACPPDMFRQSSTECRASAGACDLVESCTGSAADCPPDAFRPDTFECRASAGACDLAENCTGGSATCPADAFRPGSYVCRVGVGECDMPEVCPGNGVDCPSDVFYPPLTPCGSSADDECTRPDTCDGLGVCQENHADDRTPCRGTMTEDMCDSTCREGECRDGEPAEDLSACLTGGGAAGICCSAVCRAGGECCAAADCDDNNACTTDGCPAYLCTHPCPDPDCMILTAQSPVQQGEDAGLTLEMCPASRDVDDLVCLSNRNLVRLFLYQDFEANLDGFTTAGSVTLQQVAGNWMARICGNNASLTLSLDTTGLSDIAVSSVIVPSDMEDNEMLSLRYSPNGGTTWRALALVGDEGSPLNTLQTPHVILPPDADDNPNVRVQWIVRNANALNDCAYIDEVVVYAMLPMDVVDTPLPTQDFESDFGMFNRADPQGNDVSREYDALSWRVRLDDNEGASLYSVRLDLGAATPYDLLLLTWDWRWVNNSGNDRYVVVEYSLDGAVWAPLVATGHNDAPLLTYWRYRSLLPCPATFEPYVWVRFHAPTSTDCTDIEGVLIDNVRLEVMRPQFLDAFQAFLDLTGGIYQGAMTTGDSPGSADVICRHRCYPWSNWSTVLVQP